MRALGRWYVSDLHIVLAACVLGLGLSAAAPSYADALGELQWLASQYGPLPCYPSTPPPPQVVIDPSHDTRWEPRTEPGRRFQQNVQPAPQGPPVQPPPDPVVQRVRETLTAEIATLEAKTRETRVQLDRDTEALYRIRANLDTWREEYDAWFALRAQAQGQAVAHSLDLLLAGYGEAALARLARAAKGKEGLLSLTLPDYTRRQVESDLAQIREAETHIRALRKLKRSADVATTWVQEGPRNAFLKGAKEALTGLLSAAAKRSVALIAWGGQYSLDLVAMVHIQCRIEEFFREADVHAQAGTAAQVIGQHQQQQKERLRACERALADRKRRLQGLPLRGPRSAAPENTAAVRLTAYSPGPSEGSLWAGADSSTYGAVAAAPENEFDRAWIEANCALAEFALARPSNLAAPTTATRAYQRQRAYSTALRDFERALETLWTAPVPGGDPKLAMQVVLLSSLLPPMDHITYAAITRQRSAEQEGWQWLDGALEILEGR